MRVAAVGLLVILIVLVGAFCIGLGVFSYRMLRSKPDDQRKQLAEWLTRANLKVSDQAFNTLLRVSDRRDRWGALVGAVGSSVGIALLFPLGGLLGDGDVLLFLSLGVVGQAFGKAASGQVQPNVDPASVRVSALQPHGLTDYLGRRDLALELGIIAAGLTGVIGGAVVLLRGPTILDPSDGWLAIALGASVSLVGLAALWLQRRQLQAPMRGIDEDALVVHDVDMVRGLRDLVAAVLYTAFLALYFLLLWLELPWWEVGAGLAVCYGLAFLLADRDLRVPVARRLTSSAEAA